MGRVGAGRYGPVLSDSRSTELQQTNDVFVIGHIERSLALGIRLKWIGTVVQQQLNDL